MACIGKQEVTLLVNRGSTHNFINTHILKKIGLYGEDVETFDVKVANGEKLRCKKLVKAVKMDVQGVQIVIDLHVLSLDELDVVLRDAWLKDIDRVIIDYDKRTMEFTLADRSRSRERKRKETSSRSEM